MKATVNGSRRKTTKSSVGHPNTLPPFNSYSLFDELRDRRREFRLSFKRDDFAKALHHALTTDLPNACQGDTLYTSGSDWEAVFSYRLQNEFLKKYVPESTEKTAIRSRTWEDFRANQARLCALVNPLIDRLNLYRSGMYGTAFHEDQAGIFDVGRALRRMIKIIAQVLSDPPSIADLANAARFGSGVNAGVPFADTSPARKLKFPISSTPQAVDIFLQMVHCDPLLYRAIASENSLGVDVGESCESSDLPTSGVASLPRFLPDYSKMFELVRGDKFSVVPKDATIGRGITPTPTCNSLLQQAIRLCMEDRLSAVGLDLGTLPELHRQYALQGSIDGKSATIDLKRASENWATQVVRLLCGGSPGWLWYMDKLRSDYVLYEHEAHKVETYAMMGNAFCFPLETLLFWAACCTIRQAHTKYEHSENPVWDLYNCCSVFGDDCVVPTCDAQSLCWFFEFLGHEVNLTKSFVDPDVPFRESCGFDAYMGYNVRPVCLRAPSAAQCRTPITWVYAIHNQLFTAFQSLEGGLARWLTSSTFGVLSEQFRKFGCRQLHFIPPDFPLDSGIIENPYVRAALCIDELGPNDMCRWDPWLQRRVKPYLRWVPHAFSSPTDDTAFWLRRKSICGNTPDQWSTVGGRRAIFTHRVSPNVEIVRTTRKFLKPGLYAKVSDFLQSQWLRAINPPTWSDVVGPDALTGAEIKARLRASALSRLRSPDLSSFSFKVRAGAAVAINNPVDRRMGSYTVAYY